MFQSIENSTVRFADGTVFDPEVIVLATGYKLDLPFLKDELRNKILVDPDNNDIRVSTGSRSGSEQGQGQGRYKVRVSTMSGLE